MSHSYASSYPSTTFNPAFVQFFESFYKITDTPDAHSTYVDQFTSDATLIMASKSCKGSAEILALRKALWERVASRKHTAIKVFPFGDGADEVMIYGSVVYEMKEGGAEVSLEWAARANLVEENGVVKMSFYQVYLDTAAQNPRKK